MNRSIRLVPGAILIAIALAEAVAARSAARSALAREVEGATLVSDENVEPVARLIRPDSARPADDEWIRSRLVATMRRPLDQGNAISDLKSILGAQVAAADLPASEIAPLEKLRGRLETALRGGRSSVALLDAAARADALARLHDARFVIRGPDDFSESFDRALLIWCGAFALAGIFSIGALAPTSRSPGATVVAVAAFGALTSIGMTVLALAAGPLCGPLVAEKTAEHVAAGVLAAIAVLGVLPSIARWAKKIDLDEPLSDGRGALAAALLLLVVLGLFGTGPAGSSARINLTTRAGTFQPLELAKLLLVVAFAQHLGRHRSSFSLLTRGGGGLGPWWLTLLGPFGLAVLAIIGSAWVLGDFGAGLVLAPTFALMIVAASGSLTFAVAIAGAGLAALPLLILLPWPIDSKVFVRIVTWLIPYANGLPGGDQLALAEKAVAAAGWFGSPWPSNPDALPAGMNDLPVALLIERFGVAGLLVFVAAHLSLIYSGFAIGARLRGRREEIRYLPIALASLIAAQTAVAFAGLAGLLPLSGIVTPFLSEGGTGILVFSIGAVAIARLGAVCSGRMLGEEDSLPRGLLYGFAATGAIVCAACLLLASRAIGDPRLLTDPIPTQFADGRILPRPGPLLRRVTSDIDPAPIIDIRGSVVAQGRRSYPFGAALAPAIGVARRGIAPLPGTLESDLRAHHARFPRHEAAAELVEACAGCDSGPGSWAPVGVVPKASVFKDLLLNRIQTKHPGEALRFRPFLTNDFAALAGALREGPESLAAAMGRIRAESPSVRTTLDAAVQAEIYSLLVEAIHASRATLGAVVIRNATSGQVLVHASGEASDPEQIDASAYMRPSVTGAFGSLRDHAALHAVPPGSTFKPITAIALLEHEGRFAPGPCVHHPRAGRGGGQGNLRVGRGPGSGWVADFGVDRPHGALDLEGAIEKSCNIWFSQAGIEVGAGELGLVVSRIEVASFSPEGGLIDLATAAIGQGKTLLTADQLSLAYAAIANDGATRRCPLLFDRDGGLPCREIKLTSGVHSARIQAALRRVVASANGTGTRAKEPKGAEFVVYGKTGTAEQDRVRGEEGPRRDHAWFAGFFAANAGGPKYAFAILLARGGTGGRAAAPLAPKIGAILEKHGYFELVAAR